MATTNDYRAEVAARVSARRVKADRTPAWLARKVGISPTAMRNKLDGKVDFYIWEIAKAAAALDCSISDLVPDEDELSAPVLAKAG